MGRSFRSAAWTEYRKSSVFMSQKLLLRVVPTSQTVNEESVPESKYGANRQHSIDSTYNLIYNPQALPEIGSVVGMSCAVSSGGRASDF